jgi:hypothetical protein
MVARALRHVGQTALKRSCAIARCSCRTALKLGPRGTHLAAPARRKETTMSSNNSVKGARGQNKPSQKATGQKASRERGTATNHKKNPGKRAHQGGS